MASRRRTSSRPGRSWRATCSARAPSPASGWRSAPRSAASRERRRRAMSGAKAVPAPVLVAAAQRVRSICNACRYCEGYCAVFPALERRLEFSENEVHYLANLCHNCGACLYACQYAPPHEFQLNFPKVLAQVRKETYKKYAWPGFLASAFERNGLVVALVTAASIALALLFAALFVDPERLFAAHSDAQGSFYAVLPHGAMVAVFGVVFLFVLLAFLMSFARFWPDMGADATEFVQPQSFSNPTSDAAGLRYLDGGGEGCAYPDARPSFARRNFHHFTFYGFLLCFAATSVATIYHYVFGLKAPYPLWSLPVLLGSLGGAGLLIGPVGLLLLSLRRGPEPGDTRPDGMGIGFLALLLSTSLTRM